MGRVVSVEQASRAPCHSHITTNLLNWIVFLLTSGSHGYHRNMVLFLLTLGKKGGKGRGGGYVWSTEYFSARCIFRTLGQYESNVDQGKGLRKDLKDEASAIPGFCLGTLRRRRPSLLS